MNPWIPNEVHVQEVLQIKSGSFAASPKLYVDTIKLAEHGAFVEACADVTGKQISGSFGDFKSHLHAHGPFGQGPDQGSEQTFDAIPPFVTRVIGLNT
ncbi:MAG: hypothetical protein WA153_03995, partial [Candidatus Acidiferrales bacterium]